MKKIVASLGLIAVLGLAIGCDNQTARTTNEAPGALQPAQRPPAADNAQTAQEDAQSQTRRNQLNADIRAREERDQALNPDVQRTDTDVASEVRSKLEANLPASFLTVTAEDGVVVVTGTVPTQEQFNRIEPLAQEIRGVRGVEVAAKVVPAQPSGDSTNVQ